MSKHKDRRNLFQKRKDPAPAASTSTPDDKAKSPAPPPPDDCEAEEPDYSDMTFADAYRCILDEALETGRMPDVPSHGAFMAASARHKKLNLRNQTAHVNEYKAVSFQAAAAATALTQLFKSLIK